MTPRGRHAPPLEERLAHQRARMFEAGRDIWEREGLGGVTVEGLARHAGMSKVTVYEHFATIGEFVAALMAEELVRLRSMCEPAREDGRVLAAVLAASLVAGAKREPWPKPVIDGPMLAAARSFLDALAAEGYEIVGRRA